MKRPSLNACICLFAPVFALIAIGITTPASGLNMILMGIASIVWTVISTVVVGVWSAFLWGLPLIGPACAGLLVFRIKTLNGEKISGGDYLCGIVASLSMLVLTLSQDAPWSIAILCGSLVGFFSYQIAQEEPEKLNKKDTAIMSFVGFSIITGVIFFTAWFFMEDTRQQKENDAQTALIESLYTVNTAEAFAQDDQYVFPIIANDEGRRISRTWLLNEAPNADAISYFDGSEEISIKIPETVNIKFTCKDGTLVRWNHMSPLTKALSRRACVKRAGLVE